MVPDKFFRSGYQGMGILLEFFALGRGSGNLFWRDSCSVDQQIVGEVPPERTGADGWGAVQSDRGHPPSLSA